MYVSTAQFNLEFVCCAAPFFSIAEVGDRVEVDDIVVVLETDKVSVDVRSPKAGQITEQLAKIQAVRCLSQCTAPSCVFHWVYATFLHMPSLRHSELLLLSSVPRSHIGI
jgi:hypothetical protein